MKPNKYGVHQGRLLVKKVHLKCLAIKNYFLPPKPAYQSRNTNLDILLLHGRDRILTIMLRLTSLLGLAGILVVMGSLLERHRWDLVLVYLIAMFAIGIISYLRQINYKVRAITFLGILYLIGVIDLSFFGIAEDWRLYFSAFSILAALFLGWRAGLVALLLSLISFVTIARQISLGNLVITASAVESPIPNTEIIIAFSVAFVLANGIVISAIIALLDEFENATIKEREAAIKLEQNTAELQFSLKREQQLAHEVAFALQREEELNKLRSKIITTISHEFRTPLTVINNSASLLDKYYQRLTGDKRQEQFARIQQSIVYLTNLLQDISLVEDSQDNSIQPRRESLLFGQLCQRLIEDLKQETAVPNNLEIRIAGNDGQMLILDYQFLKQIALNLLTNASKYSSSQLPVLLEIACNNQLTLTITDQGIGIPDDEKVKIWELFYRGSNVDSSSGLGLGLYLVSQLLEIMGGTISVADRPTNGTIFVVKLPLQPPTIGLPQSK